MKLLIFSCVSTESLCKMAKVNRGKYTEKCEGQKYCVVSNYLPIHQLITFIRLGSSLPFAGSQWDQSARLTGMPCKLPSIPG